MVREAIDAAEPEFEWCLKAIAPLGGHQAGPEFPDSIVTFQLRLLEAISALEDVYRRVKQEEKRLIARKSGLNNVWFRRRMAKLAFYKKALAHVLAIGRVIGDGFAWFFYEPHRDLVDEHLRHQRQPLLPPRIGALGERLTLKHMLVIDGKLLVYHGITTFLRIGDFTLIDLKTMEVSAIGELKTGRQDAEKIQTQVSLVSADPARLPRIRFNETAPNLARLAMPPTMIDRRRRQIKVMHAALAAAAKEKEQPAKAELNEFHFEALEDVARRCDSRKFRWVKAGGGFIIGAVRLNTRRKASLGTTLLNTGVDRAASLAIDAPEWAMKILIEDRRLNSLIIGTLFGEERDLIAPRQSYPVTLWPIDPTVLADILLQRVMVITLLNPGHLWAELEAKGFELVVDAEGRVTSAKKTEGGRFTELTRLEHYTRMIAYFMMTEASIIVLLEQLIAASNEKFEGKPMTVELDARINRFSALRRRRKS